MTNLEESILRRSIEKTWRNMKECNLQIDIYLIENYLSNSFSILAPMLENSINVLKVTSINKDCIGAYYYLLYGFLVGREYEALLSLEKLINYEKGAIERND